MLERSNPDTDPITFNLVEESWLPCLLTDGSNATLSLRQVLLQAHLIQDLTPDTPTQYPPILRLLLAIVHSVAGQGQQPGPRTTEEWANLWRQECLPADRISQYLDQVRPRFDLFHPEYPFGQVARLRSNTDDTKTVALLIPHLSAGNNTPLFSTVRDTEPPALTPAEAARWLVHAQAWDTAAIKTAAVGDPYAKAGKTTGNPTGPLGQLGVLIPTGPTLRHTLLCNLRILNGKISGSGDMPFWERPPADPTWRERTPAGLLDLYTWVSRRIRLISELTDDGLCIRRVVLAAGDRLRTPDLYGIEPHTAWRRSRAQQTKLGRPVVYMPITHQPDRQLWRGLGPMLAHEAVTGADGPDYQPPGILIQLRQLAEPLTGTVLRLRGIGVTYGTQSSIIDQTYADDLPLPIAILHSENNEWEIVALDAVHAAEAAARHLGNLATNLAKAAGCRDDKILRGRSEAARIRLYANLDPQFRRRLSRLGVDGRDARSTRAEWLVNVRDQVKEIANELLRRVPPAAVRGRRVTIGKDRTEWLNAALAELWFTAAMAKDLPRPDQLETHP